MRFEHNINVQYTVKNLFRETQIRYYLVEHLQFTQFQKVSMRFSSMQQFFPGASVVSFIVNGI